MVDRARDEPFLVEEPPPRPPPTPRPYLKLNLPQNDDGDLLQLDPSSDDEIPGPNASSLSIWPLSTPLQTEIREVASSSPAPVSETAQNPRWEATGRQFWFEVMGSFDEVKFDRLYKVRCSIKALLASNPVEWDQLDLYLLAACRRSYVPKAERTYIKQLLERHPAVKELLEELFSLLHIAKPPHILRGADPSSASHAGNGHDRKYPRPLRKRSISPKGRSKRAQTLPRQGSFEELASSRAGPSEPRKKPPQLSEGRPRLRKGTAMGETYRTDRTDA